ncbi:MAG TPA: molybdopterin adenylyltransferase [Spirochaetota bacterium]|nr:molybdopterin adenylyltransferase [Spirochaetota bacterium]HPF05651.1 molybdopterin adenylyltransferase [Spirochaetota bacterium]HPJ42235.1 molybdopterin adenylyltransferase [Spirochaetota bacterium]HPR36757.1 molybdopterin adenylyltransferase [Spirochaetota bacterium]HRX47062.1 molybdopterin adenylyltransferase [Spirochaetota bacterium]
MEKIKCGIITVSDRSSRGEREDLSGPEIRKWAENNNLSVIKEVIVPDEIDRIKKVLIELSDEGIELLLTTGGTGFAPRDVTPEATKEVIEREAPGFAEAMRMKSLEITPHAMLSRAVSGIRKNSLIINLPGSPKGARENLQFIEKAIPHAIDLLRNRVTDCGGK